MRRWIIIVVLCGVLTGLAGSGCGSFTPSGLLIKGGTWVGKEVIKKEYKHLKERKSAKTSSQPAERSDRH